MLIAEWPTANNDTLHINEPKAEAQSADTIGDESSACSVDSNGSNCSNGSNGTDNTDSTGEAFLEMLGLSNLDGISFMTEHNVENDGGGGDAGTDETDAEDSIIFQRSQHETHPRHYSRAPKKNNNNKPSEPITPSRPRKPSMTPFQVPPRCSRYLHPPSTTLSLLIPNFLTPSECQSLIQLASCGSKKPFHYVTEAAHTDNDGVTHMVKLQVPNKHKLSVVENGGVIAWLWDKLEPLLLNNLCGTVDIGNTGNDDITGGDSGGNDSDGGGNEEIRMFIKNTECGKPIGLNPRIRILKYDAEDGDVFEPHFDATTRVKRKNDSSSPNPSSLTSLTSLWTVLIYLNDGGGKDFEGGETLYLDSRISKQIRQTKHSKRTNMLTSSTLPTRTKQLTHSNDQTKQHVNLEEGITAITPSMGTVVLFEHDLFHSSEPLSFGTKYVLRTDVLFEVDEAENKRYRGVDAPRSVNGVGRVTDENDLIESVNLNHLNNTQQSQQPTSNVPASLPSSTASSSPSPPPRTISELCQHLSISQEGRHALDDLGLLDVTFDALFAPGVAIARQMLFDILEEGEAESLFKIALDLR